MAARQVYSLTARTVSGDVVYTYTGPDLSVERLLQDFDDGLIERAPPARVDGNGRWLEHYRLFCGAVELSGGQWLSDYEPWPDCAILTLVLVQVGESSAT